MEGSAAAVSVQIAANLCRNIVKYVRSSSRRSGTRLIMRAYRKTIMKRTANSCPGNE